jgi:hypothetical protein
MQILIYNVILRTMALLQEIFILLQDVNYAIENKTIESFPFVYAKLEDFSQNKLTSHKFRHN